MSCRECEERIAAAARDGRTLEAVAGHLAHCGDCQEFARRAAVVGSALAAWTVPGPGLDALDAAHAALLKRLATPAGRRPSRLFGLPAWLVDHPALLAVPGAVAAIGAICLAPEWARAAAACWAVLAAFVSVVMLCSGSPAAMEGDEG